VVKVSSKFFRALANWFPQLQFKLESAEINKSVEEYLKQSVFFAFMLSFAFFFILLGLSTLFEMSLGMMLLLCFLFFILGFVYMYKYPDFKILKIQREINREIVYAGRYLVIEFQAGVPVYKALKSCAINYEHIGKWLGKIITRVDLGTPIEKAISDMLSVSPSFNLRRVLWQVLNSLKTGSDIAPSLNAVIDQIIREQLIEVKEYGRKLNPLAMFYMIIAIILPSIGIIMLVILSTFLGLKLDLALLFSLAGFFGFFQFMFYSIIKSQRPAVEL